MADDVNIIMDNGTKWMDEMIMGRNHYDSI